MNPAALLLATLFLLPALPAQAADDHLGRHPGESCNPAESALCRNRIDQSYEDEGELLCEEVGLTDCREFKTNYRDLRRDEERAWRPRHTPRRPEDSRR